MRQSDNWTIGIEDSIIHFITRAEKPIWIFYICISVISIFLCFLVLVVYLFDRRIRKNTSSFLIAMSALSEIFYCSQVSVQCGTTWRKSLH